MLLVWNVGIILIHVANMNRLLTLKTIRELLLWLRTLFITNVQNILTFGITLFVTSVIAVMCMLSISRHQTWLQISRQSTCLGICSANSKTFCLASNGLCAGCCVDSALLMLMFCVALHFQNVLHCDIYYRRCAKRAQVGVLTYERILLTYLLLLCCF